MIRNKEYRVLLGGMLIVVLINIIGAFILNTSAGFLALGTSILLLILIWFFNRRRYKKLDELSSYLHRICSGEYSLDIRDNQEGELSILKNEIYKVTLRLSEQSELLKKDKVYLADAISDISHQLKTPLTSMIMMTELLASPDLADDKRLEFTRRIRLQLERIEWLVSSLLKLSKIDAGTIKFKKEPVEVKALINKAVQPLLIPMELKEQSLVVEGDEVYFVGDFNWSAEAVVNIIKNCMEHTPVGGEIHVHTVENPLYTEVVIVDNGEGIDSEDIPNIFKRFYRGKNASSESVGIGLAMARSIVLGQNGDITVKSEKGKGTSFRIRFYKKVI